MRSTCNPCSASCTAHPRITSSISDASSAGTRRSASLMATAASSSGRVYRSAPFGALPAGVRTAETMKASTIKVLHEILDRLADLGRVAVEQMIGGIDNHQFLRLRQLAVELPHV